MGDSSHTPIPASRPARVKDAERRLEEELRTECAANAAYEAYRARGVMKIAPNDSRSSSANAAT